MIVTKPRRVTYLDVPAETWTYQRNSNATGERVYAILWLADAVGQPEVFPAGTTSLHHLKGAYRKTVSLGKAAFADRQAADAWAARALTSS